jgi:hypothetical protein
MTLYETRTTLAPAEVVERALQFFALAHSPHAAWPDQVGEGYLRLRMDVGEVVIGALRNGSSTRVQGSTSRGAHLLARFLTTLGPPGEVRQVDHRRGRPGKASPERPAPGADRPTRGDIPHKHMRNIRGVVRRSSDSRAPARVGILA